MRTLQIVAVGGGGFTHNADSELEDYLLSLPQVAKPSVGFIPTASGDSALKIQRFYARFDASFCHPSHLELLGSVDNLEQWILSPHIIYVGGGNTKSMLGVWRDWSLPDLLRQAGQQGTILCGVSAGAVCWFDYALSDRGGNGLEPLSALALVRGSCCPHYSTEPARKSVYEQNIQCGHLPDGYAIDDGVALHLINDKVAKIVKARAHVNAYRVHIAAGDIDTTVLCDDFSG